MTDFGLGSISRTRLPINFNNNQTVWYIPMYNYDGTIYVSQINSVGSLAASCVLKVNANASVSTTYLYPNNTYATAGNNASGPNYGLQFTGIDLRYYSLVVMFVGTNAGTEAGYFKFQGNNPANPSYTLTSGTAPTVDYLNNTYTRLRFYYNGSITFQNPVTLQGSTGNSYASYILNGTKSVLGASSSTDTINGTNGSNCLYMRSNAPSTTYLTATVTANGDSSNGQGKLKTSFSGNEFICATNTTSANNQSPFDGFYLGGVGGSGHKDYEGTDPFGNAMYGYNYGGGGGSAGPGGKGNNGGTGGTNGTAYGYGGAALGGTQNSGLGGQNAINYRAGAGGGGMASGNQAGNSALIVAIIPGHYELSIPGPG
jgi:hypothetical protein